MSLSEKQLIRKTMSLIGKRKKTITAKVRAANKKRSQNYWNSDDGKQRRKK